MRVVILSDTHGVIHPRAIEHLRGADHILHAGDLGDADVLERLRAIAAVTAVRGNVDHWPGAESLPSEVDLRLGGIAVHMTHIGRPEGEWASSLDSRKAPARPHLVVCGHTHSPKRSEVGAYLFLNPGSAGRKRFGLPLSLALLEARDGAGSSFDVRIVELEPGRDS